MSHRHCRFLLSFVLALLCAPVHATVWVALSEGGKEYMEAAEAVKAQLQQSGISDIQIRSWQEVVAAPLAGVPVVISLGSAAYAGITDAAGSGRWGKTPVVAAMLTRASYDTLKRRANVPGTAVFLDQPLHRQIALLRYAFPEAPKVGVLLGPDSRQNHTGLEKAASEQNLVLNVYRVDTEQSMITALQRLLDENGILLAMPDSLVFNSGSIQNILLAAYRRRVPLIGFSPAYVRAGAMLGLYSTPTQIGNQAGKVARGIALEQTIPAPQSPVEFQVGVNPNVARSLGFRLNEESLRMELMQRESP